MKFLQHPLFILISLASFTSCGDESTDPDISNKKCLITKVVYDNDEFPEEHQIEYTDGFATNLVINSNYGNYDVSTYSAEYNLDTVTLFIDDSEYLTAVIENGFIMEEKFSTFWSREFFYEGTKVKYSVSTNDSLVYHYDSSGNNIARIERSNGEDYLFTYDENPNPLKGDYLLCNISWAGGGTMLLAYFYSTNNITKIDRVNSPDPNTANFDYTYSDSGYPTKVLVIEGNNLTGNTTFENWSFTYNCK